MKCAENDGQTSTGNDVYWRIEGRVDSEEDRERISRAAKAKGVSASRFIGHAALEAANSEMQIARLEHITQIQEGLTQQLQALRDDLITLMQMNKESAARHAKTQDQLSVALARQKAVQEQLDATFAEHRKTQEQLNQSLAGHAETHDRLMAMLHPIEATNEGVLQGVEKIIEMHAHMATPEDMAAIRRTCRNMERVMKHLGIKTEDEGQPDSA